MRKITHMASLPKRNNQWAQPTSRLEMSASGQPRHSGGAGVSLRRVAVDHAARKDSRPLLFLRRRVEKLGRYDRKCIPIGRVGR